MSRPVPGRRRETAKGHDLEAVEVTALGPSDTGTLPVVGPGPVVGVPVDGPAQAGSDAADRSDARLLLTTGSLALPTLISRVTGFLKALAITAVLGIGAVSDSFTIANTLPNIVAELVLGAVLTSIIIPVLVRAEGEDADGGALFTRRLVTVCGLALLLATILAVLAAPLLTRLYLGGSEADGRLATLFAVLLLPQILFYGFSALFGAILNTREVFGLVAWAPVPNNVVTLLTLAVYVVLPGQLEVSLSNPHLLVLGIGTTLGIVAQVAVVVPALRRAGVDLRPSWGLDDRLRHFGGLTVAVVAYVLVAQVGLVVTNRVANSATQGAVVTFATAWLLLQVPYGILGVSLLTAIMPRMSRAAAVGDSRSVVADLDLGSRLSTVALLPIIVLLTVHGSTLGTALFAYGRASESGASGIGVAVAGSAFGLLPFAVVLLQLRVFYARQEAWVPTFIMIAMTVVKVPVMLVLPLLIAPEHVALGLSAASSMSFAVGAVLGGVLLRRALGPLGTGALLRTTGLVFGASLAGVAVDLAVSFAVRLDVLGSTFGPLGAVVELGVHTILVLGVAFALLLRLRLSELDALRPVLRGLARRVGLGPRAAALVVPPARSGAGGALPYAGLARESSLQDGPQRAGGVAVSGDNEDAGPDARTTTTPAAGPVPTRVPDRPAPAAQPLPVRGPRLVPGAAVAGGRYRLLVEHGGYGELRFWQAHDTTLDRDVALTFVDAAQAVGAGDPDLEGPQAVLSRTRRLGGLNTPGLARVLDVVRGSSGGIVVSEWTPGRSLREVAQTQPSPIGAARAVRALAAAAESAHRYGTALALDHPDRVRISSAGSAVLAFPGVTAAADQRTDVQGLGAVLYALATARWPLPAPGGSAAEEPVGGLPRAPLGRTGEAVEPRTLRPGVPFEISALTMRALEPDGGLRTAAAVHTVLDQASVLSQQTDMFPAVTDDQDLPPADRLNRSRTARPAPERESDRRRGRLTAGLVALGVVVLLVIGGVAYGISNLLSGGSSDNSLPSLRLDPTGGVIAPTGPPTATRTPAPAASGPVQVAKATVFSPGGTADHPAEVNRAVDGNPATVWPTDEYNQPFPRLKDGVGVMLTLAAASTLTNVGIDSSSPGTVVEIRSSPSGNPQLGETTVLATATLAAGRTQIPVTVAAPVQYVLVWITTLSTVSGKNQSNLGEITLMS